MKIIVPNPWACFWELVFLGHPSNGSIDGGLINQTTELTLWVIFPWRSTGILPNANPLGTHLSLGICMKFSTFWGTASVSTNNAFDQKINLKHQCFASNYFWTALLHVSGRSTEWMIKMCKAVPRLAHAGTAPRSSISCIFMCKRWYPKTKTVSAAAKLKQGTWLLQSVGVNGPKINQSVPTDHWKWDVCS